MDIFSLKGRSTLFTQEDSATDVPKHVMLEDFNNLALGLIVILGTFFLLDVHASYKSLQNVSGSEIRASVIK